MRSKTPVQLGLKKRMMRLAKEVVNHLPTRADAIVITSFGRAGSTLVFDAVTEALARARFGTDASFAQRITRDPAFADDLGHLHPGVVYKSHRYPNVLEGRERVRAVFLFGSTMDAALSVHAQKSLRGEGWVKQHFEHLQRPYRYDALLSEDVLGFREQCIAWMGYQKAPVLCMRYEGLWDNQDKLSKFCGLDISLPPRRERDKKQVDATLLDAAKGIYGPIDDDLARLPDCFEAAPEYADMMRGAM